MILTLQPAQTTGSSLPLTPLIQLTCLELEPFKTMALRTELKRGLVSPFSRFKFLRSSENLDESLDAETATRSLHPGY